MIFLTLGSQKFPFNRLLQYIDTLIEQGKITEPIFAQIGYSDYEPLHYEYCSFLHYADFVSKMNEADLVITHGGTGAIMTALKQNKKVVAVPRLAKYGEHVDDHQLQILEKFDAMHLIVACYNLDRLPERIGQARALEHEAYQSSTEQIIQSIEEFIACM